MRRFHAATMSKPRKKSSPACADRNLQICKLNLPSLNPRSKMPSIGRQIFGLFERVGNAVLGNRQKRASLQEQAAKDREQRARAMAERAARAQQTGEQQATVARQRADLARSRGDSRGLQAALAEQRKAEDFARRQRQEREDQARRLKQAKEAREQAVRDQQKLAAQAREALLKTRKSLVEKNAEWPFEGPAPKHPKMYKNVNTGDGLLPDQEAFLLGHKFTAFASSNIVSMTFDPRNGGDLYIQYRKKGYYKYPGVGQAFALLMYSVPSKGIATWDEIRVRGENPRLPSPPASSRKKFIRGKLPPADLPLSSTYGQIAARGGF